MNHHLIVGPGAVGRLLALRLAEHYPLTLLGRRRLPQMQRLTTPEGTQRCRPLHGLTLDHLTPGDLEGIDCVHLTTKAYAGEAAYAAIAPYLPGTTPLVLWQNGFSLQPVLSRRWTGPVLCASTTEGAYVEDEGSIVHAGHGHTWVGDLENHHPGLATALATQLTECELPARAVGDIRLRLWHKLAVNAAINPLVARFHIRNGQLRDRPFRPMVDAIVAELDSIMQAGAIPTPPHGTATLVWEVVNGTANNRASMLQDILAGRPTEHEAILAPLLHLAQEHRVAAPHLQALYQHFHDRA